MTTGLEDFGPRILFVHAHPDDESISTGGTIAALLASGGEALVVTATRGERGEVMKGGLAHLEGTPGLAPVREAELGSALAILGGPESAFLGSDPARTAALPARVYSDSGMEWGADGLAVPAADSPASAFSLADLEECTHDLLAAARSFGPSAIVSYDERGGYGHPDHVRAHAVALAAAVDLAVPFFAIIEPRIDPPPGVVWVPDVTVPLGPFVAVKARAMAAHATQVIVDGDDFTLTGGQRYSIAREESYRRLR